MKLSKYSFLFKHQRKHYAYNTLSNALIRIGKNPFLILNDSDNKNLCKEDFDKELWNALLMRHIISENDQDDYLKYKSYITQLRSQRGSMHLTLAPTMDCCFNCHYCFGK